MASARADGAGNSNESNADRLFFSSNLEAVHAATLKEEAQVKTSVAFLRVRFALRCVFSNLHPCHLEFATSVFGLLTHASHTRRQSCTTGCENSVLPATRAQEPQTRNWGREFVSHQARAYEVRCQFMRGLVQKGGEDEKTRKLDMGMTGHGRGWKSELGAAKAWSKEGDKCARVCWWGHTHLLLSSRN